MNEDQFITPEEIKSSDMILLECVENMPESIKRLDHFKPFMKKGWKTWTTEEYFYDQDDGVLIVEDNFYEINFPAEAFKPISQFHLI